MRQKVTLHGKYRLSKRETNLYDWNYMNLAIGIFLGILSFIPSSGVFAQEVIEDTQETVKARVLEITNERTENVPGTDTPHTVQMIKVEALGGSIKGSVIELENDYAELKVGDVFYLKRIVPWDGGKDLYSVSDPYRLPFLFFLAGIFVLLTLVFGGKQGLRGLLSLGGSLLLIAFVLFPLILSGYSPVITSIGVASLIIILGSYITHGFNKTTTTAVIGMLVTIFIVGGFAYYSIHATGLTGYESDEATYLHFNSRGTIDLAGLLLGGILIGLLGVLYDAAISQAIAVEELHKIAPHVSRKSIYSRAIRMGKEHIGALVDTLAIAYVGASLPLLLLFYASAESFLVIVNREIFSAEIVRTLVGSIGLILTVPITTFIATYMLVPKQTGDTNTQTLDKENEALKHVGHHH